MLLKEVLTLAVAVSALAGMQRLRITTDWRYGWSSSSNPVSWPARKVFYTRSSPGRAPLASMGVRVLFS